MEAMRVRGEQVVRRRAVVVAREGKWVRGMVVRRGEE
jgi:hypothetical protein